MFLNYFLTDSIPGTPVAEANMMQFVRDDILKSLPVIHPFQNAHTHSVLENEGVIEIIYSDMNA